MGLFNLFQNVPLYRGYKNRRWENEFWACCRFKGLIDSGQSVSHLVFGTRLICDGNLESGEKQGPSGLAWIETFGFTEVCEISMVGEN